MLVMLSVAMWLVWLQFFVLVATITKQHNNLMVCTVVKCIFNDNDSDIGLFRDDCLVILKINQKEILIN